MVSSGRGALLASLVAAGAWISVVSSPARADAFDRYGTAYRSFSTPPIGGGSFGVAGAALPDGRLLMVTGLGIYLERSPGSAAYDEVARLDSASVGGTTDPAFLAISPDGSRVAVGAGFTRPVAVFGVDALGAPGSPTELAPGVADYFHVPHFDAAWADDRRLALSAGNFGSPAYVSLLDVESNPGAPSNSVVIDGIQGASSGVAFDRDGRLYTGNGFAYSGPSDTGWIKAFDRAEWDSGSPASFEDAGTLIADVLSAGSLEFDTFGNLAVGGGDFGELDLGYLGILHTEAIALALAGFGPIDTTDPSSLNRLDPRGDAFGYYSAAYNNATRELYVIDTTTWHATVPAPGVLTVLALAAAAAGRHRP